MHSFRGEVGEPTHDYEIQYQETRDIIYSSGRMVHIICP